MSKPYYNVWVEVERVNEELDSYQECSEPIKLLKTDSLDEVEALLKQIAGPESDLSPADLAGIRAADREYRQEEQEAE